MQGDRGRIGRAGFALAALLPGLALAAAAGAQNEPSTPQGPTLKVSVELVNVVAVVKDKSGHLIPDLTRDDFEILQDNKPQQIRYFSRETDTPLTMGLLVDTSASQQRVLPIEQEEAKAFLHQILRPKDLTFVIHFDLDVELLQDLTSAQSRLDHAVDETVINSGGGGVLPGTFPGQSVGGTHLYDAVYLAATDELKDQIGRKVIILLTDGEDQGSKVSQQDSMEAAQKSDVVIYAIAVVDRGFYAGHMMGYNGESVLKRMAEQTGGRVISASRRKDMAVAFQQIADELRTQYLLAYSPEGTPHDGRFHKITVKVHGDDYKVQARRGYYAPKD